MKLTLARAGEGCCDGLHFKDGPKLLPTENRLADTGAGGGGEEREGGSWGRVTWRHTHDHVWDREPAEVLLYALGGLNWELGESLEGWDELGGARGHLGSRGHV